MFSIIVLGLCAFALGYLACLLNIGYRVCNLIYAEDNNLLLTVQFILGAIRTERGRRK